MINEGSRSRRAISDPARLRLCPSSPICSIWAMIVVTSSGPCALTACYRTELHPLLKRINTYVMRWARAKYRRLHGFKKAKAWWDAVCDRYPRGFAHWQWTRGLMPT